jgi:Tfp pilus assembly protein PilP
MKVKVAGENGQQEGTVVRVLDDYGVLTVVVPEGRGQAERMYRIVDVEVA